MDALLVGRFHAVTRGQLDWLHSLAGEQVGHVLAVITSASQARTRRNPTVGEVRARLLRAALTGTGIPFDIILLDDVNEDTGWVPHVARHIHAATGRTVSPAHTRVHSANREVSALFEAGGYTVARPEVRGLTPHELLQRMVDGREWEPHASEATAAHYRQPEVLRELREVFGQKLLTDDGELGHRRDFQSYGAQMDASLGQKLDDIVPWVTPGHIVDKGCGTGKLLVALSRRFPGSRLTGVDLSRELLRVSDGNTYATDDVTLVLGNVMEPSVPPGSASTVIFSSVMHEVHSYSGYRPEAIHRALRAAALDLAPGGRLIIRDGLSPGADTWRLELVDPSAREMFPRFVAEFRHGQGAPHRQVGEHLFELDAHHANEFICKKDYLINWHLEVNEEFGPLTLDGWGDALRHAGFRVVHLAATHNPWIIHHRYQGKVKLTRVNGEPLPWPATNCVVVGERQVDTLDQ